MDVTKVTINIIQNYFITSTPKMYGIWKVWYISVQLWMGSYFTGGPPISSISRYVAKSGSQGVMHKADSEAISNWHSIITSILQK